MLILGIILFILFGLLLLIIELFIIPGFGLAGIGSIILFLSGISISFLYLGSQGGIITLLASVFLVVLVLYFTFKYKTWSRIALKDEIDSKAVETDHLKNVKVGDRGMSLTRLGPIGEIEVNGYTFEAFSSESIIDAGTTIEVTSIKNNKIIIKSV